MAPPTNWEADRMLNMYINDYFLKRNLKSTAQIFQSECSIPTDAVAIDSPDGFLWEWWSVFWDVFVSRYAEQSSDFASPSSEQQQQQVPQQQQQQQVPHHQQQMPHQQQRGKRKQEQQSMSNTVNVRSRKSPAKKSKSAIANTSAFNIYEEGFKLPLFPDPTIEALMKGKRSEVTTVSKAPCYNESSLQSSGLNQSSSCLALKGWPLSGLEQLQRGIYPPQNSSIKPCMPVHQFPMQQQQRMLQSQKLASASISIPFWQQQQQQVPQQQQQQQVPHHQQQMPPQQQRGKRKQEQQSMSNTVNVRSRKSPAKKSKSAITDTSAFKIYEEGFKLPLFPDPTIEALMKGKRSEVTTVPKAPCYNETSLQSAGLNQSSSCLALKGWPLSGLEQLQRGIYTTQNSSIKPCMPVHQFPMPQQQRMLQSQKLASASDLEAHKLRMLNNCHLTLGRNYPLSNTSDVLHNTGSTLQYGFQNQHIKKIDELLMQQQQMVNNNYIQQLCMKNSLLNQLSQSTSVFHDQGHMKPSEFFQTTDHLPSTFTEIDQGAQYEEMENQKLAVLSPCRSSEVANALAPSSSNISTHSARSLGENVVSSQQAVPYHGNSCKALVVFGADPNDSLTSDTNEKVGDHFQDNRVGDRSKATLDSSLTEIKLLRSSSTAAVECCHFSSDGKLLVTGDSEKKAILWRMESFSMMSKLEEHMHSITDVRFSSSMPRLATSSVDGIVRVWSVDNANRHNTDNIEYPICTFSGHSSAVMSLDFHPCRNDLLCSCDNNSEIRYWSIRNSCCAGVFKGGANHIRFQPQYGRILAAAMDNNVSLLDVETQICRQKLQGHKSMITNVCWDPNGDYLASVSNDLVRVWKMGSGSKAECVQELISGGSEFHTCVFHPTQPCSLILASYKSMEIWDMVEKRKVMNVNAHEGLISSLAASTSTGLIASASHDGLVKIWK